MSIKKKGGVLVFFGLVICFAIIFFVINGKKDSDRTFINPEHIKQAKYVVSVGEDLKEGSYLLLIDRYGKCIETIKYNGMSIDSVNESSEGNFFLHSRRLNKHFRLEKNGKLHAFSLLKNKYHDEDWYGMASWCASTGQNGLIETMNIGNIGGKYLSNVLYRKKIGGNKTEVVFKDANPFALLEKGNKIFAGTYFEKTDEMGLSVINKNKADLKKIKLNCQYASDSMQLFSVGNKVITYGDNKNKYNNMSAHFKTQITAVDAVTYKIKKLILKDKEVHIVYPNGRVLNVVTSDGYLYKYDNKLRLVSSRSVKRSELYKSITGNDAAFTAENAKLNRKNLYIWRVKGKSNKELIGYIEEYDKNHLKCIQRVEVRLDEKYNCAGDECAFSVRK